MTISAALLWVKHFKGGDYFPYIFPIIFIAVVIYEWRMDVKKKKRD
jgi:hypothetical protein